MAFDRAYDPIVDDLNARLRHATPQAILREALAAHPRKIALVSSFGAESAVLLDMAAKIDPSIPVLFLDTGQLFGQTLDYRKSLARRLGLTDVRDLRPAFADLAVQDPKADLWKTDTDACCNIRKTLPLDRVLRPEFDAWITGRKRFQAATRASLPVVERGEGGKIKFNPLANWSKADLDAYVAEHDLPQHPLTAFGYPSIGCWPCTKPVEDGADARSGRWAGSEKIECGIHTPRASESGATPGDVNNVGGGI
jgi:phosphoadenosine phosphosulfate reductase